MFSFLIDLLVGVFDFVLDVFTLRRLREHRGHSRRAVSDDAQAMVSFDFITVAYIGAASAVVMLSLKFLLGLSTGLSVGIGLAAGVVWGLWRYMQMVNER